MGSNGFIVEFAIRSWGVDRAQGWMDGRISRIDVPYLVWSGLVGAGLGWTSFVKIIRSALEDLPLSR